MARWTTRYHSPVHPKMKLHIQKRSDLNPHIFNINFNALAAGRYRRLNIYGRPRIPIPFLDHVGDFTLLLGDWYKSIYMASNFLRHRN